MTSIKEAHGPMTQRHPSPPLWGPGIAFVVLSIASLAVTAAMAGRAHFPTHPDPVEAARAYYAQPAGAVRMGAFLLFASAIPLGIFTAVVTSRLRFLGLKAAGVSIALFGGLAASFFLAICGLTGWALSQPGINEAGSAARALQLLGYATGGAGYVVPLGLLLAGVSVTSAFGRLLPRWLIWLGLIIAVLAELSTLSLVLPQISFLLPLSRFPALVWIIGVGFAMPDSRDSPDSPDSKAERNR